MMLMRNTTDLESDKSKRNRDGRQCLRSYTGAQNMIN